MVPCLEFVKMKYTPIYSQKDYVNAYMDALESQPQPFFLEMIIYSKQLAVLMEGNLVTEEEYESEKQKLKTNRVWPKN